MRRRNTAPGKPVRAAPLAFADAREADVRDALVLERRPFYLRRPRPARVASDFAAGPE
ncbi:hypothetical protein SAMN02745121_04820 [Nannocystis exedens]|uniref:Uncharacterized protein n=1 Tax=Nannocystis exedens TaxID=54 RepID=A0A1I2BWC0_9BACT|nr:hypothetical protein NAEX_04290 [Nannocystis exedens]SFE60377.1 hypothetical protein SAMN02745121_04820 [Nannocystis exedens]